MYVVISNGMSEFWKNFKQILQKSWQKLKNKIQEKIECNVENFYENFNLFFEFSEELFKHFSSIFLNFH